MITRRVKNLLGQFNTRLANIVTYKTSDSSHTLTARTDLAAVADLIKRLDLFSMIVRLLKQESALMGMILPSG